MFLRSLFFIVAIYLPLYALAQNSFPGKNFHVHTPLSVVTSDKELANTAVNFYESMLKGDWNSVKALISEKPYVNYGGVERSRRWTQEAADADTTGIEINTVISIQYNGEAGYLLPVEIRTFYPGPNNTAMHGESVALNVWYKVDGHWRVVFINEMPISITTGSASQGGG